MIRDSEIRAAGCKVALKTGYSSWPSKIQAGLIERLRLGLEDSTTRSTSTRT